MTEEQIRTPHDFLKTTWGQRLPDFIQEHLNETGYKMANKGKIAIPTPMPPTIPPHVHTVPPLEVLKDDNKPPPDQEDDDVEEDPIEGPDTGSGQPEIEIYRAKQKVEPHPVVNDPTAPKHLFKRQATQVRDTMSDMLSSSMGEAASGFWWGFDNYTVFAQKMFNITNNKVIPERLVASAGLPFGFCRNGSMLVKKRMKEAKCKHQEADTGNNAAFAIVFIGIMFIGVGHSMPWTLGVRMGTVL